MNKKPVKFIERHKELLSSLLSDMSLFRELPHPPDHGKGPEGEFFVFLHIPKTAGTSINYLLKRLVDIDKVSPPFTSVEVFTLYQLNKLKVLSGHISYERIRWYFSFRDPKIFTVLRDPVQRLKSVYRFYRSHGEDHPDPAVRLAVKLSPLEFFCNPYIKERLWNEMTRFIVGESRWESWRKISQKYPKMIWKIYKIFVIIPYLVWHIRRAFVLVGFQENLNGFSRQLCKLFGKRPIYRPPRINVSPTKIDLTLTPDLIKEMEELVELDFLVYNVARVIGKKWTLNLFGIRFTI